jgi:hypothetical protein
VKQYKKFTQVVSTENTDAAEKICDCAMKNKCLYLTGVEQEGVEQEAPTSAPTAVTPTTQPTRRQFSISKHTFVSSRTSRQDESKCCVCHDGIYTNNDGVAFSPKMDNKLKLHCDSPFEGCSKVALIAWNDCAAWNTIMQYPVQEAKGGEWDDKCESSSYFRMCV